MDRTAAASSTTPTSTSARSSTTGYDVNIGYTGLEIGRFGSLAFNLTGTYLDELITQPAPGIDLHPGPACRQDWYDCAGYYSTVCGTPKPQWRHRFRTSWQTPWDLDLSVTWRYYRGVTGSARARTTRCPWNQLDRELPAEDYFDLAANWAITEKATVSLGINNVLDDNPASAAASARPATATPTRRPTTPSVATSSCGQRWTSSVRPETGTAHH